MARVTDHPTRSRSRLAAAVFGVLTIAAWTAFGSAASAHDPGAGWQHFDIGASESGYDAGDAYFIRQVSASGETLKVHLDITENGGIRESSVCVKDEPFTGRELGTGGCTGTFAQATHDPAVSTYDYEVALGSNNLDDTLYVQVHVTLANPTGDTAFAGHTPGKPFYGNVEVNPPETDTCPEGSTWNDDGDGVMEAGECEENEPEPVACPDGMTGPGDTNGDGDTNDEGECSTPQPVSCPAGMTGPGDTNGDGDTNDEGECSPNVEGTTTTCPSGTSFVDANNNGVIDDGECRPVTDTKAQTNTGCPDGQTWNDANGNGAMDAGECRATEVAGVVVERPAPAAAAPAAAPQVAGAQVEAAQLAATGFAPGLALIGAGSVVAGSGVVLAARKRRQR